MLDASQCVLLVIDVQDKLFRVMHQRERLADDLGKLIRGIRVFGIPAIVTEQYPEGLGRTIPEISELLADVTPLSKLHFSCYREPSFTAALDALGRRQVIVCGIESHICVYQTTVDLIAAGYEVHVVADGVSSRTPENCAIGLDLVRRQGASVTSVEAVLFELLGIGSGDRFRAIRKIIQ
jgi:nicotinamidase-related amidase